MLIVENRDCLAVFPEDLDNLLEKRIARIERLSQLIARVVAVLADDEHRVHIEPLAAAPQCLGYTGIDLEAELRRAFQAQVSRRSLIDVERHDVEAGLVPFAP